MIRSALLIAAALLIATGVARILFLLVRRRPVRARTCASDLTEMQRCHDGDAYRTGRVDGRPSPADIPVRLVLARVAYEIAGVEHRADVRLIARKGERAEAAPLIWYDPAAPSRATGIGTGAAMALLVAGGALVALGCRFPA